jgi:hypothetical protein
MAVVMGSAATALYAMQRNMPKIPMHTSILTGQGWLNELLQGAVVLRVFEMSSISCFLQVTQNGSIG